MKTSLMMDFSIDRENNKVIVKREFAASLSKVWNAWTQKDLLDQWWAPKPWKTQTKMMDFREGGHWLYSMLGPEGEEHFCRADFRSVSPRKNFRCSEGFCDQEGKINNDFPLAYWNVEFNESEGNTFVTIEIKYDKPKDLEKYIEMGFKEGFTAALENLHELFK